MRVCVAIALLLMLAAPARAEAPPRNPVLILPGFFMPEVSYGPLKRALRRAGYTDVTVLEGWPWFGSIPDYARQARREADRALARTGAAKIEIVSHSMGGLVGRYLIQELGYEPKVAHYVSFGTPHHGTLLGVISSWYAKSGQEMAPGSPFLTALNAAEGRASAIKYTSLHAGLDEIVWPQSSVTLAGAENAPVANTLHIWGVFTDEYARMAIEALER